MYHNHEHKLCFIESVASSSYSSLNSIFNKTKNLEIKLGKDIADFTLDEISHFFRSLHYDKLSTYRNTKYYLKNYIDFSNTGKPNVLSSVGVNWHEQFFNPSVKKIINKQDFDKFLSRIKKEQTVLICQLIFEGVGGDYFSEIRNLKKEDINWNNDTLRLTDNDKTTRLLQVSKKCMCLIKQSLEIGEHIPLNGRSIVNRTYPLTRSDYVIRRTTHKSQDNEKASDQIIRNQFKPIKDLCPNFDLTYKNLKYSGIAYEAINLSKKIGVPVKEFSLKNHWCLIANRYNLKAKNMLEHLNYEEIMRSYQSSKESEISNFKLVKGNYKKEISERKKRGNSGLFRDLLFSYYERCAISGETTEQVLEACHIQHYINKESDHVQNGILLRSDLHNLYDIGLIDINDNYTVKVHKNLISPYYKKFDEQKLILPEDSNYYPSKEALAFHRAHLKDN